MAGSDSSDVASPPPPRRPVRRLKHTVEAHGGTDVFGSDDETILTPAELRARTRLRDEGYNPDGTCLVS